MRKVKTEKAQLRQKISEIINKISPRARRAKSRAICDRILSHPFYRCARSVMFFVPKEDEPDIRPLIFMELRKKFRNKNPRLVFAPRMNSDDLEICPISNFKKDLRRSGFGILEPKGAPIDKKTFTPDLIIVPARAYDESGHRLGRGLGYYDRFLKKMPKTKTIGVVFDECFFNKIPSDKKDVSVGVVITDKRTIRSKN